MFSKLKLSILVFLGSSFAAQAEFVSDIFSYDDPQGAKNIHVCLKGETWMAREMTEEDIPFHQELFAHPKVMTHFTDGQPRTFAATEKRIRDVWLPRFENGHPHGGLTIFNHEDQPIGHVVAGVGGRPGSAELARSLLPDYWGKKIGSGLLKAIVTEWAPEVRRIGLGEQLDAIQDLSIIKAFQCFQGETLQYLEATASPSNEGSWKSLQHYFSPAEWNTDKKIVLDLREKEGLTAAKVEGEILKLYDAQETTAPLKSETRYRLIDPWNKEKTFSQKIYTDALTGEQKSMVKYHFEYTVP